MMRELILLCLLCLDSYGTIIHGSIFTTESQQLQSLKAAGINVDKLDDTTQLKVFLHTWLTMERFERG